MTNRFRLDSNGFLKQAVDGFFHTEYFGYRKPNNPDFLNELKNDLLRTSSNNALQLARGLF